MSSPLMSPHASSGTRPLQRTQSLRGASPQKRPVSDYLNPDVATVGISDSIDEVLDALLLSHTNGWSC